MHKGRGGGSSETSINLYMDTMPNWHYCTKPETGSAYVGYSYNRLLSK